MGEETATVTPRSLSRFVEGGVAKQPSLFHKQGGRAGAHLHFVAFLGAEARHIPHGQASHPRCIHPQRIRLPHVPEHRAQFSARVLTGLRRILGRGGVTAEMLTTWGSREEGAGHLTENCLPASSMSRRDALK
jgi:hypothetical protein